MPEGKDAHMARNDFFNQIVGWALAHHMNLVLSRFGGPGPTLRLTRVLFNQPAHLLAQELNA